MATILRWFKIDPFAPKDLKRISDGLLVKQYNDERGWGFQLADVRKDFVSGRYIVKEKRTEIFRNPKGEMQTVEYWAFRETEFRIQTAIPHIEIVSPSRGVTEMFNLFGQILKFEVSISVISIDPIKWQRFLKQEFNGVKVQKAVISDIQLSMNAAATITIAGTEDIQKFFKEMVRGKKYVLDSATIAFTNNDAEIRFEVSRSAGLEFSQRTAIIPGHFFGLVF